MENYSSDPYRYPPPPPNSYLQAPPPPPPPPNSYLQTPPSPQTPQSYPYNPSPFYPQSPYSYPNPNSPSSPHTYPNSPFYPPAGYSSPQPSLQYSYSNFRYTPGSYPPRFDSFSDPLHQETAAPVNVRPSDQAEVYPSNNQLARIRISDQTPGSSPGSPSVLYSSPSFQSPDWRYHQRAEMFGRYNHSVSNPMNFDGGSQHGQSLQVVSFDPSKSSLKVLLLHGSLDIWIIEATNLPNMDGFSRTLVDAFGKKFSIGSGSKIDGSEAPQQQKITSDPYVSFSVSNAVLGRTFVICNSENPVWTQHFHLPVAHYGAEVRFLVKDDDVVGSQIIGTVKIPVEQIYTGLKVEGSFPILSSSGKPCKQGATLRLSIQYIPIKNLTMYHHGVEPGPDCSGVPFTYFPLRKGGKVTLYQDAHIPDGCLPDLKIDQGMHYEHGKCWRDISEAISQARRLIYITGWSVYHKVRLVRDASHGSDITLGELLKSKSQEGVRVLLLVWDDPTSKSILGYKKAGLMDTHDEETRSFFKHSSVHVLLCPRSAGKKHSWAKQQEVGAIYTHHQKTVIVDSDADDNKRKIIAFVGGLDLCNGRYDTPSHPLFRTLQTVHKEDFHNPTFVCPDVGCPREPWHDLHSRIDGPAAYDVLTNFEERWLKASRPSGLKKLKKPLDDALLKIERIPDIIGMLDAPYLDGNDPEAWHVQVFRSIDSNSVKGFPKDPKEATSKNLVCGKNVLIDMSIHTAYVQAIRAAQHFIYIENQYFLGSSYNWNAHKDLGANNLIPMEIALKIANKIKANERFSVYIVVPMWPEGVPTGVPTQRILYWQNKTMQMMYETVYKALEEAGLEKEYEPRDYLNFFCLGNREALDGNDASPTSTPTAANTPQTLAQRSRRFMIYVHSKGMIVDDEYVILGSANINQRSMEGTRDTEIAMGAYQPQHTWARKLSHPNGQIYGYRMSLWAEHIGTNEDSFIHPESLECVRRVRFMGEYNWQQFAADKVTEMRGHLMKYPVDVDKQGKVKPLAGCETFPDVGGNIVGSFVGIQENLTI